LNELSKIQNFCLLLYVLEEKIDEQLVQSIQRKLREKKEKRNNKRKIVKLDQN